MYCQLREHSDCTLISEIAHRSARMWSVTQKRYLRIDPTLMPTPFINYRNIKWQIFYSNIKLQQQKQGYMDSEPAMHYNKAQTCQAVVIS